MRLGKEWWQTVRYAIGKEGRTVRLISILVTVGVIVLVLITVTNGVSVTVGV
ncbi:MULTISPECIES: hypothetical protein [unclassified Streptomyces]|uniref:hypothetical protein n=1 Tax=unclassified Streptomyces TaxID=2593676 RepID=UPI000F9DE656|nr:hypothetical protein EES42_42750 [Streptomyces sp. ADI95-17]WSP51755.1 hypothetical protein OG348_41670 [Streptomyces sp. NBC_01243]WSX07284.1 hypothetical protein OG355_43845 [Streptomyces sp. NBC_00987]